MLNVLAGRSSSVGDVHASGKVSTPHNLQLLSLMSLCSQVKIGGRLINPVTYRRNIAYVMQDDCLMPTATPREALAFSARLRLPSTFTDDQITEKVNNLLKALGIEECADTLTGGAMIKGISGGQRKRTSVGIELITEPTVSHRNIITVRTM